jgi:hypothetical protein
VVARLIGGGEPTEMGEAAAQCHIRDRRRCIGAEQQLSCPLHADVCEHRPWSGAELVPEVDLSRFGAAPLVA